MLKDVARRVVPAEVIDRPKGYFPVPPLVHLRGHPSTCSRDALTSSDAARQRGLFHRDARRPRSSTTPRSSPTLRYNQLWELGVLELWLQTHGIGDAALTWP